MPEFVVEIPGFYGAKGQFRQGLYELAMKIADEIILPAFREHYDASGLRTHSGRLVNAVSKHYAPGNITRLVGSKLQVGVDTGAIGYRTIALTGYAPIRYPRTKRVMRWIDPDTGKAVFAKAAGPIPMHDNIIVLTDAEMNRVYEAMQQGFMELAIDRDISDLYMMVDL